MDDRRLADALERIAARLDVLAQIAEVDLRFRIREALMARGFTSAEITERTRKLIEDLQAAGEQDRPFR